MATNNTESINLQNITTDDYYVVSVEIVSLVRSVCYFGVIPILIAIGLVLNILCLVLFSRLKNKTSTIIMLVALTVTDMLCLLNGMVNVMFMTSVTFKTPFSAEQLRQAIPIYSAYLNSIPFRVGNCLTFLLSLERLYSVLQPMRIRQYSTKKNAYVAIVSTYACVILVCIPNLFLYKTVKLYSNVTNGYVTVLKPTSYGKNQALTNGVYVTTEMAFRYIPVIGVAVVSFITGIVVLIAARRRSCIGEGTTMVNVYQKEIQVTKTLLTITFVFLFCQLPFTILRMVIFIDPEMTPLKYKNNIYDLVFPLMYVLRIVNSVVNFLIYYKTSSVYRDHIKTIFCKNVSRRKDGISSKQTFCSENSAFTITE